MPSERSSCNFCKRIFSSELYSVMIIPPNPSPGLPKFRTEVCPIFEEGAQGGRGKNKPRAPSQARGVLTFRSCVYPTFRIFTLYVPPGVSTFTVSPTLWLRMDLPIGDSLEIFPARGLASAT